MIIKYGDCRFVHLWVTVVALSGRTARKSAKVVGKRDPLLLLYNKCGQLLSLPTDINRPDDQRVTVCHSKADSTSPGAYVITFKPREDQIQRRVSDGVIGRRVSRNLSEVLMSDLIDHIMGKGWCKSIVRVQVGGMDGKSYKRPDDSMIKKWRSGQGKRAPYWKEEK